MKEEEYIKIKEEYLNDKISLTNLSKKYNISRCIITKRLKSENININNIQNKSTIIGDYFEVINTEEKAYWLGFWYADGYVALKTNHLEISLQKSDINHLVKFAKAINFTKNIAIDNKVGRCRICFANKKMHKDLIDQGCIPQKSLKLEPPKDLQNNLIHHFIRGYFDGDGSISFNQNKEHRPTITFLGTKNILSFISINLLNEISKTRGNHESLITLTIEYCGKTARNLLKLMYENSSVHLDRKYKKYIQMKTALLDSDVQNALSKYGEL